RCPQRVAPRRRQTSYSLSCGGLATPASFPFPADSDPDYRRNRFAAHAVLPACLLYVGPSVLPLFLPFLVLFLPSDHFNRSGVSNVVMMTMITTAPKIAELITGSFTPVAEGSIKVAPIPAKISPTSPRGIIPKPIARRLIPRSTTPKAQ